MTNNNFCFSLQNRLVQTSQTGGQPYNDTSPFSNPCFINQNPALKTWFSFAIKVRGDPSRQGGCHPRRLARPHRLHLPLLLLLRVETFPAKKSAQRNGKNSKLRLRRGGKFENFECELRHLYMCDLAVRLCFAFLHSNSFAPENRLECEIRVQSISWEQFTRPV
jgi:hypothetical protein